MKTTEKPPRPTKKSKPKLLSGGNPQIPKGDGDAPVRAYMAAVPGWDPVGLLLFAGCRRFIGGRLRDHLGGYFLK